MEWQDVRFCTQILPKVRDKGKYVLLGTRVKKGGSAKLVKEAKWVVVPPSLPFFLVHSICSSPAAFRLNSAAE